MDETSRDVCNKSNLSLMINYTTDSNSYRGTLMGYHRSPAPQDFRSGASVSDIAGLRPVDRASLKQVSLTEIGAKYGIGFEVEKASFARNAMKALPLFAGYERDSSCGYEAVTNILPLLPASEWRNKVYSMFHQAERILDDQWSPSNQRCGGHITLSCDGMNGGELMEHIRPYCGILLSLYRRRLKNSYCARNPNLRLAHEVDTAYRGIASKYNVAKVMSHGIEFRLPSRVRSVNDMKRRYELMYVLVDCARQSFEGNAPTWAKAMSRIKPIISLMYRDEAKEQKILSLAKDMQKFINTGKMEFSVLPFIDPYAEADVYFRTRRCNRLLAQGERAYHRESRW